MSIVYQWVSARLQYVLRPSISGEVWLIRRPWTAIPAPLGLRRDRGFAGAARRRRSASSRRRSRSCARGAGPSVLGRGRKGRGASGAEAAHRALRLRHRGPDAAELGGPEIRGPRTFEAGSLRPLADGLPRTFLPRCWVNSVHTMDTASSLRLGWSCPRRGEASSLAQYLYRHGAPSDPEHRAGPGLKPSPRPLSAVRVWRS